MVGGMGNMCIEGPGEGGGNGVGAKTKRMISAYMFIFARFCSLLYPGLQMFSFKL